MTAPDKRTTIVAGESARATPSRRPARRWSSPEHRHVLGLAAMTVVIFAAMSLLHPALFLTAANLQSMAFQFPEFAILALAMMLAMLTGGIDLSVVGTANLSSIVAALVMTTLLPGAEGEVIGVIALAIATGVLVGCACGLLNGLCIAQVGIPPILATLGTGLAFTGIALVITGGPAVTGLPPAFAAIGTGTIGPVPIPLAIFAVLAAIMAFVLNRTAFGISVYLYGTNELAARFAGLRSGWLVIRTYVVCGALSSIGGLVMISRANSAKADYGQSYLLIAILIAVLGGTNPYGGFGRVAGLVLAVLSLQFLSSGFNMMQIGNFAKELVWGLTLLAVMSLGRLEWSRSAARRGKT